MESPCYCQGEDVLLTIGNQTRKHALLTVIVFPGLAFRASVTDVCERLEACTLADFEILDGRANLDNDAGALMASTLSAEHRHLGQCPIVHHEMDI